MLLRSKDKHEIASSEITPKDTYRAFQTTRRSLLAGMGAVAATAALPRRAHALSPLKVVPSAYTVPDRATTPEAKAQSYNNFYEYGEDKSDPAKNAGKLHLRPWTHLQISVCRGVVDGDSLGRVSAGGADQVH